MTSEYLQYAVYEGQFGCGEYSDLSKAIAHADLLAADGWVSRVQSLRDGSIIHRGQANANRAASLRAL